VAALAWACVPWISILSIKPNRHADIRFINNLFPFGLGILPLAATKLRFLRPTFGRFRRTAFAGFAFAVLLWQLASCVAWLKYTRDFSAILSSNRGYVELKDSGLSRCGFDWPWTMPCMSVALSGIEGKPLKSMVLNRPGCVWEPFDSRTPSKFPELSRYGVKYEIRPR
jgi:hypothetical protein